MAKNTIVLKGDGIRKEAVASEAITPGHVVEFGGSNDIQKHGSAAGQAAPKFAVENDIVGDDVDDDYDSGDTVQFEVLPPGAEVHAMLAHGENASVGSKLVSDGNGALAVMGSGQEDGWIATALEALNNTSGSESRIEVEVA